MSDYLLVIKVPVEAVDDPDAREKVAHMLKLVTGKVFPATTSVNLLKIFSHQPPRKVELSHVLKKD